MWGEIGLVLAGSAGPLIVTLANARTSAAQERNRWRREDRGRIRNEQARFIAAATQVLADWFDYATVPARSIDEERELDERRDAHYAHLNELSALLRLCAEPEVVREAEAMLAELRIAQRAARDTPAKETPGVAPAEWPEIEARFAAARARFIATCRDRDGLTTT